MLGNEQFGSPKNPLFLLKYNELFTACPPDWTVVRFEQGYRPLPAPAMVQRLMAIHVPAPHQQTNEAVASLTELQSPFCISLK